MFATNCLASEADGTAREIAQLYAAMWRLFQPPRQAIIGSDVTPRMLGVLRHLAEAGPLTLGEQALHLGISRATASELVDRLEAKCLVARMRDQRDQRRVFVWLTEEGRQRVASLSKSVLDEPLVEAVAALPTTTREQIVTGLAALVAAANSIHRDKERVS